MAERSAGGEQTGRPRLDRRARRRQETTEEILDLATEVMTEHGVNGLTLAEVARRLGVQTPSLYKYFPSIGAVYDALFERAARQNLDALLASEGASLRSNASTPGTFSVRVADFLAIRKSQSC